MGAGGGGGDSKPVTSSCMHARVSQATPPIRSGCGQELIDYFGEEGMQLLYRHRNSPSLHACVPIPPV